MGNKRAGRVERTTKGVYREDGSEQIYWGVNRGTEPVKEGRDEE